MTKKKKEVKEDKKTEEMKEVKYVVGGKTIYASTIEEAIKKAKS